MKIIVINKPPIQYSNQKKKHSPGEDNERQDTDEERYPSLDPKITMNKGGKHQKEAKRVKKGKKGSKRVKNVKNRWY